jgi:hypothetical protein
MEYIKTEKMNRATPIWLTLILYTSLATIMLIILFGILPIKFFNGALLETPWGRLFVSLFSGLFLSSFALIARKNFLAKEKIDVMIKTIELDLKDKIGRPEFEEKLNNQMYQIKQLMIDHKDDTEKRDKLRDEHLHEMFSIINMGIDELKRKRK